MNCQLKQEQVKKVVGEYGSPLYIFHKQEFVENYWDLLNTFRSIYPKYNIAYSYKTNYTPRVCQLVKEMGGLAEVVSEMEYALAKKIGYSNDQIIYNGPIKGRGLFDHLMNGGTVNIDNLDEMDNVIRLAEKNPDKTLKIAFRVNVDIGQGFISRFGLDTETAEKTELDTAFELVKSCPNLTLVGMHCHVGRSRSVQAWKNRIDKMFKLLDHYFGEKLPEFISLGSGMNSVMEPSLAEQFDGHIPTYQEYANVVAEAMNERYKDVPLKNKPFLFTEPGTTLISGYMSFLTTVKNIKTVRGKMFATFDSSDGNMGDICRLKRLPISVFQQSDSQVYCEEIDFVGYTCIEHDVIYKGYSGKLGVGDIVQFRNVGSYSNVFKPPFILPNCAMIEIDEDGNTELIKRAETLEDIFQTYIF